jgi:glycosyltransferase involved in cell wall biosynthesis
MRVAIVSEPGFAGVKRHVVDLLHHLDTNELELLFLYSLERKDAHYEREIAAAQARGIRCVNVGMVRQIRPWADLRAAARICRELRVFRPEVVHLHSSKAGFLGRVAAKLVVHQAATIYTPNALACFRSRFFWMLEKAAGLLTDRIVAVSPSEADDIRRWQLVQPSRVICIPLCVRPASEYPTHIPSVTRSQLVAACGRICQQKSALLFFKTAASLLRTRSDIRFIWIGDYGDDEEAAEVRNLVEADPCAGQVKITGWVPDADARIASADIFCMTSCYESFGYVTADAMMIGVPVVGVRATGTSDLVLDGQTGLLCEPDESELANRIARLVDDRGLRSHLALNARDFVETRFSRERMICEITGLYRSFGGRIGLK